LRIILRINCVITSLAKSLGEGAGAFTDRGYAHPQQSQRWYLFPCVTGDIRRQRSFESGESQFSWATGSRQWVAYDPVDQFLFSDDDTRLGSAYDLVAARKDQVGAFPEHP
jgi:hypothetical protein